MKILELKNVRSEKENILTDYIAEQKVNELEERLTEITQSEQYREETFFKNYQCPRDTKTLTFMLRAQREENEWSMRRKKQQ